MLIPAVIKIAFDIIHESVDDTSSVEWSIAYNFVDYVFISAALMLTSFIAEKDHEVPRWVVRCRKIVVPSCVIASIGYWVIACIELTYIGESRSVYDDANGDGFYSAQGFTIVCSLIFYTFVYIGKTKKESIKWI